jgi:hypothetical protein
MNENNVVDIWMLFKEHVDKKQISIVAEQYIDVCADLGVEDSVFKNSIGNCDHLDHAIGYYLDIDDFTDE